MPSRKSVTALVDAPFLAELVNDSSMLDYLMRAGAHGVVLKPATVGSIMEGRDIAMASGSEILRLFRMEGIVNIWMWEQIKDQPIRPEATYIFSNKLNTFESMLSTLQQNLGSDKVRSYRDESHDFGGDIPGNFIIEALAPIDEIRSITIGLDRTYRERLAATGLVPILEIATADDVKTLPASGMAIMVTANGAAAAAYSHMKPTEVYISRGVTNPGWASAKVVVSASDADSFSAGAAVIAKPSDIFRVVTDYKAAGFTIVAPATAHAQEDAKQDEVERRLLTSVAKGLLAAYGAWFLFWGICDGAPDRRTFLTIGCYLGALSLIAVFRADSFQEYLALIIPAIFAAAVTRRMRDMSAETAAWQASLGVAAALLAGALIAPGRPTPMPWTSALLAAALASLAEAAASANPFILAGIALAATNLLPRSLLFAGILLPLAALPAAASLNDRQRSAVILFAGAAALTALAGNTGMLSARLLHALFLFIALFLMTRLSRRAPANG